MINLRSKRGYEFSFTWIFTVIVGAFIIFLAIYFAIRLVGTEQFTREAREGRTIGILLTPIETQTEEAKVARIILRDETVLFNECEPPNSRNIFGTQRIGTTIDPPIGERVSGLNGSMTTYHNKYLFTSSRGITGKEEMYVLTKPLWLPFKVADLVIVWSDQEEYCFQNPPGPIRNRLNQLDLEEENVEVTANCADPEKTVVCFDTSVGNCEISVYPAQQKVVKDRDLFYLKSLEDDEYAMMFAAIFSDPAAYECQAKRILAHASKLADLHHYKSSNIIYPATGGCGQRAAGHLLNLNYTLSQALNLPGTSSLIAVNNLPTDTQYSNFVIQGGGSGCEIF